MRAALLREPGHLEIVDLPPPEPGAGEVVLRVRAALTCGTDVKTFVRGHPQWQMPMRFGHEFSGVLESLGPGVEGWRVGDEIVAAPTGPCGACRWCLRRQENLCATIMPEMVHGAYGELLCLPNRVVCHNLYRKPEGLSFAEAAFLEPLACVVHGLEGVRVEPQDHAVVIGAGPIGLLQLAVLRARGVERVTVVARRSPRSEAAASLGAANVLRMDATVAIEAVREVTGGGADLVIECTGRPEVWEAAPRMAARGADVILFGGCPAGTNVTFSAAMLHYDQVRLRSPFHYTPRDAARAFDLLATGQVEPLSLLTEARKLEHLEATLHDLRGGRGIKYVVEP